MKKSNLPLPKIEARLRQRGQNTVEEFKEGLLSDEVKEAPQHRWRGKERAYRCLPGPVLEFKDGVRPSVAQPKPETALSEEGDEATVDSPPDERGEHKLKDGGPV